MNDLPADLPVIRAQGDFLGDKVEFLFLDDERNPLTLAFRIGIDAIKPLDAGWLQLCKTISKAGQPGRAASGRSPLRPAQRRRSRHAASDQNRFSVRAAWLGRRATWIGPPRRGPRAGARDRPQGGCLQLIFLVQQRCHSGRVGADAEGDCGSLATPSRLGLGINGHTGGVGGDSYNLDLSKRRAAAVKAALVTRYGIDETRLRYAGFGKAQPKDTNETLEGRARNRRVELLRD